MPSNEYTPKNTCVVACSGPSLNNVDVFSLGYPVVCISTAIRSVPKPHYWMIADSLNQYHGKEGKIAWEDDSIIKVVPKGKKEKNNKSIIEVEYRGTGKKNEVPSTLFSTVPLIRGPHKTITFAIQWLHLSGFTNLIFAGNDLSASSFEEKYAYSLQQFDKRKKNNFKKTIDDVHFTLGLWYPFAKSKGYEWYSWKCGPVFSSMVPELPENFPKINEEIILPEVNEEETFMLDKNITNNILKRESHKVLNSIPAIDDSEWRRKKDAWIHEMRSNHLNIVKKADKLKTKKILKLEKYRMEKNHE